MPNPICRLFMRAQRRSAIVVLPLLTFALITPMTVSCQRSAANPESGIEELRGLVLGASGRPAASDLTRIESRYPRTRTAALARFLRGYLYYGSKDYSAAVEALDGQAIGATTSLGDYAFFYRAESEAASDSKGARRDYGTVYTKYPDSLKGRDARLRAAEMAIALGDPAIAIKDLARMAEQELAAVQLATMDELTMISNRRGFESLAVHALGLCRRLAKPAALLFVDLDLFKQINDRFGHAEGDRALLSYAGLLKETFRNSDVLGRLGGDEFAVLATNVGKDELAPALARLREAMDAHNRTSQRGYELRYSVGAVQFDAARHANVAALMAEADALMYAQKQQRSDSPVHG